MEISHHTDNLGIVQANEGHFWHIGCNRKLKNQASLNLIVFLDTYTKYLALSKKILNVGK